MLDARPREAFALTVGAVNACDYCQSAYTISATRAGLTEEQNLAIRSGRPTDDAWLNALLRVVREDASQVGCVGDGNWNAALDDSALWGGGVRIGVWSGAVINES